MIKLPQSIADAVENFSKLPGVGEKTAFRQIMGLVNWDPENLETLAFSIQKLSQIKKCVECGLYTETDRCAVCTSDERQDAKILCVVESISDLMAIEKSQNFNGIYHVLGGVLNPLMGIGPHDLKIDRLVDRVKKYNIETVILAVNPSVEGDATCSYIGQQLVGVQVERIGFGIPMGGSLEYLDPLTITKALENRKSINS
ncbi:MAG: recombination protein RecR [Halobacteriovoraceae bacterium]|nr:recombination protein RecR [Halobacteriovoraceae bacterium]|tara:strand:+ start:3488 stop:4087 length:600 start_codon:yes stop_codon:yes gene_type:complete